MDGGARPPKLNARISPVDRLGRSISPPVLEAAEGIVTRAVEHAEQLLIDPAIAATLLEDAAAAVSRALRLEVVSNSQRVRELFEATNPGSAADLGIGPTFDELLDVSRRYLDSRVRALEVDDRKSDLRDVGIYYWRRQALDVLENAVRGSGVAGVEPVPILGNPEWLDSATLRRFQWTGVLADGKRCHTNKVPCHTELEKKFADFLDRATDIVRYFKNERFGFSVTYYEGNRPRQYYPDFIIVAREADGREVTWLAETKGEIRPNTAIKSEAARLWCERIAQTSYGT